jgi:hypothetical protein
MARTLMRSRVRLFGNNQPWSLNRRYAAFHAEARKRYRPTPLASDPEVREAAASFERDGFLILPSALDPESAERLKSKVDSLFEQERNLFRVGSGLFRLIDGAEQLPEVIDLVSGKVAAILETYYKSNFKLYNASFYRTVPDESVPESSFLWHFDNCTDEEIKIMVYLDKVTTETGAFRFKSVATSERARAAGFWHRDDYDKARDVFDDPSTTVVAEGEPGTVILFRQGRVVHKATAPRMDHRDAVTMVVIPSLIPWREHYARTKHLLSTNAGICVNPWTDEPENIGYRY